MKNIKSEKGSLALFVTIAMLFFMAFLLALFLSTANEQKTQLAVTARIKETYEQDLDNVDEIYSSFVGTDEYIPIYTAEQLKKVGTEKSVYVAEVGKYYTFNLNSKYILKNNIELNQNKYTVDDGTITFTSNAEQWTPIGTSEDKPFTGIFDGNGYKISGIYINDTSLSNQGLFGYNNGTIKNVIVDNGYISASGNLGSIVSQNLENGIIDSCINNIYIIATSNGIGGICAINYNIIKDCTNNGRILANGSSWNLGGICGGSKGKVINCNNKGEMTTGGGNIGGIVGTVTLGVVIENCYNEGKIVFTGSTGGGIVGYIYKSGNTQIKDCYNRGNIDGANQTGGIVGQTNGINIDINNCYNIGNINGNNNFAGIVGIIYNTSETSINNCYNAGKVTGEKNGAGIVGYFSGGTIQKSYNKGNIIANLTTPGSDGQFYPYVGGIVGRNGGNIRECYNEGQIEGNGLGVAGIAGVSLEENCLIEKCYNIGKIIDTVGQVGGIVGTSTKSTTINMCYNLGEITGASNVGGIIGWLGYTDKAYVKNSYNLGIVKATNNTTYVGGIGGRLYYGSMENCYNIGTVYVLENIAGNGITGNQSTTYTREVKNCYYLTGTATGGINGADVTEQAEVKTAVEMRSSNFVTLLNNEESNWKIVAGKNDGYPILNWEEGTALTKVSQIITGFEDKTLTLSGSVAVPVYYGNKINLNTNDKYYVEFDYQCASGTNKFDVDLYPDDLPQIFPVATTTVQHGMWIVSSTSSNMASCQLRFFDNVQEANESDIIITNITMYQIQ